MKDDELLAPGADVAAVRQLPLSPGAADAVCELADVLGLDHARIDLDGCEEKDDLLGRVAAALEFPDWFGGNWDAYFDCLADLGWRPARGYVLVFENTAAIRRAAPEAFDTSIAILGDAAKAWAERGVPFVVLIDRPALSG